MVDVKSGKVKSESLCKRVSENLFSIATSVAKVQAHEVRLKVKSESLCKRVSENLFSIATSVAKVQAHEVRLKLKAENFVSEQNAKFALAFIASATVV